MPRAAPVTATSSPTASSSRTEWLVRLTWTALAVAAAGMATLALGVASSCASPLSPAAGIALAAVLVYGWRMLGGVAVGTIAAQLVIDAARGRHEGATTFMLVLAIAVAATLQAAAGAALVRRYVRRPLTLTLPRDIAVFFACCAASSVVAASLSTLALRIAAIVPASKIVSTWSVWWLGDLAGLLIATPVVLTLIGMPRSEWAPRRVSVGLTMTLVTVFLGLGIVQATRWNDERLRASFTHDASSASLMLETQLEEPLHALEALRGVFNLGRHVGRAEMRAATQRWLDSGAVGAMGWSERVRRDDLAGFEARARSEGMTGFRVSDGDPALDGADPAGSTLQRADDVIAVRLIEPLPGNAAALGSNGLAMKTARAAILRAIDSGQPEATRGFRVAPQVADDPRMAIAIYQAVYDSELGSVAERRAGLRGLVFVTLQMDAQLAGVAGKVPAYLRLCVVDSDPLAGRRRLAGRAGCESERAGLGHEHPLVFAGRQWDLRGSADPDEVPESSSRGIWTIAAVGLLSAAMLGASLLITTGRTRRIESAVRERTAALRAEVAERHVAETALRASEQRFRNIIDNVPIGVVYTDLGGRVIQANPRFCELTGYDERELTGLSPEALTHPEDLANDQLLTAQLVAGEIPMYRRHKRCLNRAGEVVWVRSTVSLLRDPNNQPWRIVGVVEDITEHLRLEEAERAREAAELSNRAKSDFLSRMSHELRTPLNAMLGFAQLLEIDRRHPLTAGQRPWVAQIQQAGWHLLEMINDVLDLSRIDSGNLRLQTGTLELGEVVQATTALVASDADKRGIRISQELAPEAAAILGDATRVKQILTNLLSNAVKYNIDNGRVHVASRLSAPDVVEVSVTDTGMGMTPEQMEELFRPFNRLGRERTTLQGTGIGLVISRRLAELMGGSIRVKSVPGEGSSFILRLPKAIDPDTIPSSLDDDFAALAADYHRRIVLYVEDNETNVEVMRGILAQRAQVQMEVAMSGLVGLASVRERMPHLILLDMHLPDMSGLDFLRHLKADPATSPIPVIVVSADATAQQVDAALDAGAVRYLTKPVGVNELLSTVDDLLDRMDTGFS
ncbi:MAG TPA: CHASE domain-containing protein [Caldimonas sp.]|nr:CHASE domain-containing protein [Caldimonas sp.]HEX4234228.1 CHASE domain-containing protein [Caldimonas sp.]